MPIFGDKQGEMSLRLIALLEKTVNNFCFMQDIPREAIPELISCKSMNRLARNLKLNVRVVPLSKSKHLQDDSELILSNSPKVVL